MRTLLARHLGAHLPGRPTVIVKTMPGAGGLNGTNYLANVAARDGTVLGVVPQTVAIAQALGEPGLRYDVRAFNWIGRINSNVEVQQTWHTAAVKTIADAQDAARRSSAAPGRNRPRSCSRASSTPCSG